MKCDYHYLKKMLTKIEENPQHTFVNLELAKDMGVDLNSDDDAELDKFVGHLRLLQDQDCIDCTNPDMGFKRAMNDHWMVARTRCRLTNRGHELLDLLRKPKVLEKIAGLAISTVFEVGKAILLKEVTGAAAE